MSSGELDNYSIACIMEMQSYVYAHLQEVCCNQCDLVFFHDSSVFPMHHKLHITYGNCSMQKNTEVCKE